MGFRGGASEALIGACVKSDPEVDRYEIAPILSVTSCFGGGKVPRPLASGEGPGGAGVVEPHRDETTQVECGGAVVQPVIVLGYAAVSDFAVAAGQPCDGPLNHRAMFSIFVLPLRISG